MTKINKNDIINQVAEDAYLSRIDAKAAVDAVFNIITDALKNDVEVSVANFATFVPINRKERIGTSPTSHKLIKIKSRKSVSLRMSKELKEIINGKE